MLVQTVTVDMYWGSYDVRLTCHASTEMLEQVYVVDQHESLQRGEELPLEVTLTNYVSPTPVPPGVLMVDPSSSSINAKSGAWFNVRTVHVICSVLN